MGEWQPIKTAPLGIEVRVRYADGLECTAVWNGKWLVVEYDYYPRMEDDDDLYEPVEWSHDTTTH